MPDPSPASSALQACWLDRQAIVNLRGRPDDEAFLRAAGSALGLALPTEACRTARSPDLLIVWAGPDDWFVIGPDGHTPAWYEGLRQATSGLHAAVTDVSSGYAVLQLAGPPVRDVLAQGCPLDLHPRAFGPGQCAGSHFFKASVWLWPQAEGSGFELLVRRSFQGYVGLMLQRATRDCGLRWTPS